MAATAANGLAKYEIRYCPVDMPGAWTYREYPATGEATITGIDVDTEYILEVRCWPRVGRPSKWKRVLHTVTAVADTVPVPENVTVVSGADHNKISCTLPAKVAADVEVEYQWTTDSGGAPNAAAWTFLERGKGTETKDTYTTGATRWYRCRTVDYQGNFSAWSASKSGKAKTSDDGATSTAEGTVNLLGANAGQTLSTTGNGWAAIYYSQKPISSLGLEVGDNVSVSGEIQRVSGTKMGRILVRFYDASKALVGQLNSDWISPVTWTRAKLESITVPANTHSITVGVDVNGDAGKVAARKAMLNTGRKAAPYAAPAVPASTGSQNIVSGTPADEVNDVVGTNPVTRPRPWSGGGVVRRLGHVRIK
jgi:hypothetical protein